MTYSIFGTYKMTIYLHPLYNAQSSSLTAMSGLSHTGSGIRDVVVYCLNILLANTVLGLITNNCRTNMQDIYSVHIKNVNVTVVI